MMHRPFRIFVYQTYANERFYAVPFFKGLVQAGAEVQWNQYKDIPRSELASILNSFKPDFVLFYGFTFKGLISTGNDQPLITEELKIPYVSYFCDNPFRYLPYIGPQCSPDLHRIFICDSELVRQLRKEGYKNTFYLPLSFDPDIDCPGQKISTYTHDLVFAGTALDPETMRQRRLSWPPDMLQLLESVKTQRMKTPGQFLDVIQALKSKLPTPSISSMSTITWSMLAAEAIFDMKLIARQEFFEVFKEYDFHIYGIDPSTEWPFTSTPHPMIDQHTQLPSLYRSSRIHLCLESLPECCHQRVMECSGCEGFIISENNKDTAQLYDLDKEAVVFSSLEDLKYKVNYYLENPQQREYIAKNAYKRAISCHTVKIRAQAFLKQMETIL